MLFRCIYTSIVVWFFLQFFFSFLKMGSPHPPARVEVQCKCKTRSLPAPSAPSGFMKRPIPPNPTTNYLAQGLAHMQNEYKPARMSAITQPRPSTPSPRKAGGGGDERKEGTTAIGSGGHAPRRGNIECSELGKPQSSSTVSDPNRTSNV